MGIINAINSRYYKAKNKGLVRNDISTIRQQFMTQEELEKQTAQAVAEFAIVERLLIARQELRDNHKKDSVIIGTNDISLCNLIKYHLEFLKSDFKLKENTNIHKYLKSDNSDTRSINVKYVFILNSLDTVEYSDRSIIVNGENYKLKSRKNIIELHEKYNSQIGKLPITFNPTSYTTPPNNTYTDKDSANIAAEYILEVISLTYDDDFLTSVYIEYIRLDSKTSDRVMLGIVYFIILNLLAPIISIIGIFLFVLIDGLLSGKTLAIF